jgi:hypothetical protein
MSAFRDIIFFAGVTLAISAGPAPCAHAQTGPIDLPSDVIGFVGRRASCLEWSKKATDLERAPQIDLTLKCSDIASDERAFRRRYASNPEILAALDATWVKVVKRLPVRITPATPSSDLDH